MAYSKIILNGETLMDVTSDTVDSGNLLDGETATKNSGAKVTGSLTIPVTDVEVNGTSVVDDGVAEVIVPTKVSDLTNDSGYITGYTETDPTVPSWAKQSSKPTYTANEVGALPSSTVIPTITDTYSGTSSNGMSGKAVKQAIDALDGTVSGSAGSGKTLTAFSQTDGKVSATFGNISITKSQVSDFPAIPSKTSDLTNDSGFITGYTETDPIFTASPAHGISSSDINSWDSKQDELVSGTNIKTINNTSILGSGDISVEAGGTSTPTASEVAEFDSSAHMNSTDMTSSEVSDFVDGLNMQKVLKTVETKTLLWTNTSPTSDFASQTVLSGDLDGYDGVEIMYKAYKTYGSSLVAKIEMDSSSSPMQGFINAGGTSVPMVFERSVAVSSSGVQFSACNSKATNSSSTAANAGGCIPYKIYGYKMEQL